jgi:protein tyrosine/serine phosphatase
MKIAKQKKTNGWLTIAAVAIAIGIGVYVFLFYIQTYHFAVVTPGVLYRMGVRDNRELATTIRRVEPKTVVCLVTDQEVNDPSDGAFRGEFALLKKDGIKLDRIPMRPDAPPTQAQMDEFLRIVMDKKNQPVIVHCAQGVVRTGMMVAAYERNVLGYNRQQALDAVNIFGKGHERADEVRAFINAYYKSGSQSVATSQTEALK